MKITNIKVRETPLSGQAPEAPARIPLEPLPVPAAWEQMLLSRWQAARDQSGKFPEMTITDGVVTLACRREDYLEFLHKDLAQKVAETNELYDRKEAENREARRRASEEREATYLLAIEIAAFNELRRLSTESTPATKSSVGGKGLKDLMPEMALHDP